MRSIIALLFTTTTALGGCVVYDETLVYEDTAAGGASQEPQRPGDSPTGEPDAPAALSLFPAGAVAGDLTILSLCANGVNLDQIVEVTFLGQSEIDIIATARRGEGEFLMTIDTPADSERSTNHLLADLTNGTTLFLEDAFSIVSNAEDIPLNGIEDGSCD